MSLPCMRNAHAYANALDFSANVNRMSEVRPSLESGTVKLLTSRLVEDPGLRLPGSLTQLSTATDAGAKSARSDYLSAILSKDPGVFLERHGELLTASELMLFESLRTDYEVNFYFRQLQQQLEPVSPEHLSAQTKNRRLAQLNRLIDEGTYFEDGAMRCRAPLLHQQYVGQYRLQKDVAATAASDQLPAERGAHPLSGSVLARMEEAKTQQKLIQQQAAEAEIDHESSEEEDWPEDRRAEMQQPSHSLEQKESPLLPETQPRSRCDADSAAGHPADNVTDDVSDQKPEENSNDLRETRGCVGHPPEFEAVVKAAAASLRRTQGPRGEARTAALLLAHAGQQTPPSSLCTEVKQRPPQEAAPAYIHIPDEEQVQLQAEFLVLMHQRYLAGEEEDVDYRAVDADQSLDDDLTMQIEQDAEDAYFDAD